MFAVKRQEARKEVPVNKQLVRSESRTQNNKPERPLGASSCRQVDVGAGARLRGHALQALGGHRLQCWEVTAEGRRQRAGLGGTPGQQLPGLGLGLDPGRLRPRGTHASPPLAAHEHPQSSYKCSCGAVVEWTGGGLQHEL